MAGLLAACPVSPSFSLSTQFSLRVLFHIFTSPVIMYYNITAPRVLAVESFRFREFEMFGASRRLLQVVVTT